MFKFRLLLLKGLGLAFIFKEDKIITYKTYDYSYVIGRVTVLKEYREFHIGTEILKALEIEATTLGMRKTVLTAQCRA